MIFRTIILDIMQAVQQYGLDTLIYSLLLTLILFAIRCLLRREPIQTWSKWDWMRLFGLYLLCVYGFLVVSITILSRPEGSRVGVNFELFATISGEIMGIVFPVENVLLFIPLGVLIPLMWRRFRRISYMLGVGLLFSALIEIIQFITKRGYLQTDDILLNVSGTIVGYLIYISLYKVFHMDRK